MKKSLLLVTITLIMNITMPSCTSVQTEDSIALDNKTVENEELNNDDRDEVASEFDAQGNPTGEYAKYLWDKQRIEEAQEQMAEEAMKDIYEDEHMDENSGFPF